MLPNAATKTTFGILLLTLLAQSFQAHFKTKDSRRTFALINAVHDGVDTIMCDKCRLCKCDLIVLVCYACALSQCSVNCHESHWTSWSPYGSCSVTCGRGVQTRTRSCSIYNGQRCDGPSSDTRVCGSPCPGANSWEDWSSWSSCDRTCGIGHHFRTRQCSVAASATGSCPEKESKEMSMCFVNLCPTQSASTPTVATTTVEMTPTSSTQITTRPTKPATVTTKATTVTTKATTVTTKATTACGDVYKDCKSLGQSICSGGTHAILAMQYCREFCGFCGQSSTQTTTVKTVRSTQTSTMVSRSPTTSSPGPCADIYNNCANLGNAVCVGQNVVWAKQYCRKYCRICI